MFFSGKNHKEQKIEQLYPKITTNTIVLPTVTYIMRRMPRISYRTERTRRSKTAMR